MLLFILVVLLVNLCGTMALFLAWLDERQARRELEVRVHVVEHVPYRSQAVLFRSPLVLTRSKHLS